MALLVWRQLLEMMIIYTVFFSIKMIVLASDLVQQSQKIRLRFLKRGIICLFLNLKIKFSFNSYQRLGAGTFFHRLLAPAPSENGMTSGSQEFLGELNLLRL